MDETRNVYTQDAIASTFLKTALPIILLASINGLLTLVDGMFLGAFVGSDALTAVTMVFPVTMLLFALATMISSGAASIIGRLLGANQFDEARKILAGAHGLALCVCVIIMTLFALFGWRLTVQSAQYSADLASMGHTFLSVAVYTSPLMFLLTIQSDALRTEGHVGFMAIAGLVVTIANICFNYLFIAHAGLGVAGSAWGTALAQALALVVIVVYRAIINARLTLGPKETTNWRAGWSDMLALGAPRSLSFIGIAAGAAATILSLHLFGGAHVDASIAAYGVISRMMTFAYFPMLGMSLALQAMISNNFGAGLWSRSNAILRLALLWSFAYTGCAEMGFILLHQQLGGLFVVDPAVTAEVAAILPTFVAGYFTVGPMMMIANYFQSIGDVGRSALLSLARTYLFAIPLIFVLPVVVGEGGIWLALPIADALLVVVTIAVLKARRGEARWGLFQAS